MKLLVGIVMSMFVLGSVSLLYTAYKDNKNLDQGLIEARRRSDSLFRIKESAEQNAEVLKLRVDSANAMTNELKKSIVQVNARLAGKDREIANSRKATDEANKKVDELLALQKSDRNHLKDLIVQNDNLTKEKNDLNARILVITESNEKLSDALRNVKDNILVETYNQSGKLNVKAKRVRKIAATLSVPLDFKKLTFKFFDSNENLMPEQNGAFAFHTVNDANSTFAGGYKSTKIKLTYSLTKKIGRGTYKIEMLDDNKHIGNLMVSLK